MVFPAKRSAKNTGYSRAARLAGTRPQG